MTQYSIARLTHLSGKDESRSTFDSFIKILSQIRNESEAVFLFISSAILFCTWTGDYIAYVHDVSD